MNNKFDNWFKLAYPNVSRDSVYYTIAKAAYEQATEDHADDINVQSEWYSKGYKAGYEDAQRDSVDDRLDADRFRTLVDKERCVATNKCLIQVINLKGVFDAVYFKAPDESDKWKDLSLASSKLDAMRKAVDLSNERNV